MTMVRASFDGLFLGGLGDMLLLLDHHERRNLDADIIEGIYLDSRVTLISTCFTPPTDRRSCFGSMVDLLENCVSLYHKFIKNEQRKDSSVRMSKSFLEFLREKFNSVALPLKNCIAVFCFHIARSHVNEHIFKDLASLYHSFVSFEAMLSGDNIVPEEFEQVLPPPERERRQEQKCMLYKSRDEFLSLLGILIVSLGDLKLPDLRTKESIKNFCFQSSSLIFSTASTSFKLHSLDIEPINILVIYEAGLMKECESIIPLLLLPDLSHVILVGHECQKVKVESRVSFEAGFARSLFERLNSMGRADHFLNLNADEDMDLAKEERNAAADCLWSSRGGLINWDSVVKMKSNPDRNKKKKLFVPF